MKRILPVAVLFVVLLVLVIARETSRARLDTGGAADEFVPLAVTKFAPKDAARIEVTAPGGTAPAFTVEKSGAGDDAKWVVTAPFRAPAHAGNADKLCEALASGDAEMRADDAGSLRDLDLVPERAAQVRVADAAGQVLAHVAVGRSTGARGAFVRFLSGGTDTRAFETTADLRGLLGLGRSGGPESEPEAPKATHFRDRTFPAVDHAKAKRIEVVAPGRRVAFEKRDGKWACAEGGPGLPVNEQGIDRLLQKFGAEFHAKDLADPADLAKLGLANPPHSVAVTSEDGTTKRVLGAGDAAQDEWYVRLDAPQDPEVVWEATSWEFQQLFPVGSGLFTFEDAGLAEDAYSRLVVEKGATRIEMTRDGTKPADDWKLASPDWPLVPRQGSLRSLASLARGVKPVDWVDGPPPAPSPDDVVLRIGAKGAADADLVTVRIAGKAPSGKDRLAVVSKHPDRVVVLADSTVDRIAVSPTSLFEAKVLHGWAEADVKAVRVEPAAAPDYALERTDTGWVLVRGEARERKDANAESARKWVEALLALETREGSPAARRFDAHVTVERTDGTSRKLELSVASDPDGKRTVTLGTLVFETDRRDLVPAPESLLAPPAAEQRPEEK